MQDINFLGWSGLGLQLGKLSSGGYQFEPLTLDWQPGDIRNCSYAPAQEWIGITAEDRTHGQQVLAVYDVPTKATRLLVRENYVLHNSFNRAGTQICYTQPSTQVGAADLFLYDFKTGRSRNIAKGVAYGVTPAWFPDDERIAYSSPQGKIEVIHVLKDEKETLVDGTAPAIHPDGVRLAFQQANQLLIFNTVNRSSQQIQIKRRWLESTLTDGLSWSPDGRYLSFGLVTGLVGKRTIFYLLDNVNRQQTAVEVNYLRGLIII
jgi:Tol biopolymer transport system component